MNGNIHIRYMKQEDITKLACAFAEWGKTGEKYLGYYEEQRQDSRVVLVAHIGAGLVAYVTVISESTYEWFKAQGTPEIVDLNVTTGFQRQGIGTGLILAAEELARGRSKKRVGISVHQSPEFADAQRLYLTLGYVPDGHGVTPHDNELHLIKNLTAAADTPNKMLFFRQMDGS